MRARLRFLSVTSLLVSWSLASSVLAQEYEVDPEDEISAEATPPEPPLVRQLPVEASTAASRRTTAPPMMRESLFRMGLKVGGNYTIFQDGLCIAADEDGCLTVENRSFSGVGFEGRVSFGWDLAHQPLFLETEFAYRRQLSTALTPLNVLQIQQGLYYRARLGSRTLWKPGLLMAMDVRLANNSEGRMSAAAYPALGLTMAWEFASLIFQPTLYLHEVQTSRNFLSSSMLLGMRF